MEQMLELYQELGISPAVYAYGEQVLEKLKDRFAVIDQVALLPKVCFKRNM